MFGVRVLGAPDQGRLQCAP